MNGLSLIALVAVACAVFVAYRYGRVAGRRDAPASAGPAAARAAAPAATGAARAGGPPESVATPARADATPPGADATRSPAGAARPGEPARARADDIRSPDDEHGRVDAERMRIVVAYEAEAAALRRRLVAADAERDRLAVFAEERRTLLRDLATARGEVARYRQVVVDLENDAPPPILGGPGAPHDLKLIVGIGPALERMLQQLGIGSYRQIARWTEHDIDEFDARLPEFPGRIRRDAWVTQARELHYNKYGERP